MKKSLHRQLGIFLLIATVSGCQQFGSWQKDEIARPQSRPAADLRGIGPSERPPQADELSAARDLERHGELDNAVEAYQRALQQDPQRGETYQRLAVLYAKRGDLENANQLFDKAGSRMSPDSQLLTDHGYCLLLQGRLAEAEDRLRQSLRLDPSSQRTRNNLGIVLARRGLQADAIAMFAEGGATDESARNNLRLAMQMKSPTDPTQRDVLVPPFDDRAGPQLTAVKSSAPSLQGLSAPKPTRRHLSEEQASSATMASFESETKVAQPTTPERQVQQESRRAPLQPALRRLPAVRAPQLILR
jgi:tetratricopeptide (TPR) repeat protein